MRPFPEDSVDWDEMENSVEDVDAVEINQVLPVHGSLLLPRTLQSDTFFSVFVQSFL